jgi:hypothetical protein
MTQSESLQLELLMWVVPFLAMTPHNVGLDWATPSIFSLMGRSSSWNPKYREYLKSQLEGMSNGALIPKQLGIYISKFSTDTESFCLKYGITDIQANTKAVMYFIDTMYIENFVSKFPHVRQCPVLSFQSKNKVDFLYYFDILMHLIYYGPMLNPSNSTDIISFNKTISDLFENFRVVLHSASKDNILLGQLDWKRLFQLLHCFDSSIAAFAEKALLKLNDKNTYP